MPLFARVEITDLAGTLHTVGGEERGFRLTLRHREASTFQMLVSDPQGTFRRRYEPGAKVEVFVDSATPPAKKVFRGVLEYPKVQNPGPRALLALEATDYFHERLLGRRVAEVYQNQKAGAIARDLIAKYLPGFNTANVQDTDYTVESKVFPYVSLKEALDWLADASGSDYFCDANLNVFFYPRKSRDTGLAIGEGDVAPAPESARNLRPVKNSVIVIGGFELKVDQQQPTVDVSASTSDAKHYAVRFSPDFIRGKQIQLHLEKVGSPEDLLGRVVEDRGGLPTGPEVAGFVFSKGFVGAKGWYPARAEHDYDTAKSYWIVLDKVGDANNHYKIYRSTDTPAAPVKESDDGMTWSDPATAYTLAFKTQHGEPVLSTAVDPSSRDRYALREVRINDTTIVDKRTAKRVAFSVLERLRDVQQEVGGLKVRNLDVVPQPGELIQVTLPSIGVDGKFLVREVQLAFPPGHAQADLLTLSVGDPPPSVEDILGGLLRELREERMRGEPIIALTALDRVETFAETLGLADTLRVKDKQRLAEGLPLADTLKAPVEKTLPHTYDDADAEWDFAEWS